MTEDNLKDKPLLLGDNTIDKLIGELTSNSKVKVSVDLHEGHDRPNLSFMLIDANGELLARSFIVNSIDQHIDFTLHIRHPQPAFPITIHCESFFEDDKPVDQKDFLIEHPAL